MPIWNKIITTWSQIYVDIDHYLLAIICGTPCVNKLEKSRTISFFFSYQFEKRRRTWSQRMPRRVFKPRARETWRSIQDIFYKSKTSSRFPNFDASNAWQMVHNSREGFFSFFQELLSDFAA